MKVLVAHYPMEHGFRILKTYGEGQVDRANQDMELIDLFKDQLSCKVELRDPEIKI